MENSIFWDVIEVNHQSCFVATTNKGLCYFGGPNETYDDMEKWLKKYFKGYALIRKYEKLLLYIQAIQAYTNKLSKTIDVPLDLKGTAFQLAIWQELLKIPYGETVTYSDVAEKIGNLKAVRAVGGAIGANPVMIVVPCHRVIGKNGKLTGFRGGLEMKTYLLELENIDLFGCKNTCSKE